LIQIEAFRAVKAQYAISRRSLPKNVWSNKVNSALIPRPIDGKSAHMCKEWR
jgi:hypothetical protein